MYNKCIFHQIICILQTHLLLRKTEKQMKNFANKELNYIQILQNKIYTDKNIIIGGQLQNPQLKLK